MFMLSFHYSLFFLALNPLKPGDALCLQEMENISGKINIQGIWKYASISSMLTDQLVN